MIYNCFSDLNRNIYISCGNALLYIQYSYTSKRLLTGIRNNYLFYCRADLDRLFIQTKEILLCGLEYMIITLYLHKTNLLMHISVFFLLLFF